MSSEKVICDAPSKTSHEAPQAFWVSWWGDLDVAYTLHTPWWISGYRYLTKTDPDGDDLEQPSICAAVLAWSEDDAQERIKAAHDERVALEWRFVEPQADDWSPFNSRFRRADWMQWPAEASVDGASQKDLPNPPSAEERS